MAKPSTVTNEDKETIRRMTTEGYGQKEIGLRIGCSQTTVGYHQRKMGLKASNKWNFGESVELYPEVVATTSMDEKPMHKEEHYIDVVDQNISITGNGTKFKYNISLKSRSVRIETGYSSDIEIDIKDMDSFVKELTEIVKELARFK